MQPFFVTCWPVSGSLIKFSFFPLLLTNLLASLQGCLVIRMGRTLQCIFFFLERIGTYEDCDISYPKDNCSAFTVCCPLSLPGSSPDSRPCFHGGNACYQRYFFCKQTCEFSRLWFKLYSFKPYLDLLCSIFFDLLPEGFVLQTKVMMFACFTSQLLCEQQTRDENLTSELLPSGSSIASP